MTCIWNSENQSLPEIQNNKTFLPLVPNQIKILSPNKITRKMGCGAQLFVTVGILTLIGNVQSFPQNTPDMSGLTQLIRQTFEGYMPQNTRTYTIIGNGGTGMFPLDKAASFPIPPNVSGPVRSVASNNYPGYPSYSQQTIPSAPAQNPGWKPSEVNPYSYLGNRYQQGQGRADFSHEVEEVEEEDQGTIITVDDIDSQSDDAETTREIQIESSMSFSN